MCTCLCIGANVYVCVRRYVCATRVLQRRLKNHNNWLCMFCYLIGSSLIAGLIIVCNGLWWSLSIIGGSVSALRRQNKHRHLLQGTSSDAPAPPSLQPPSSASQPSSPRERHLLYTYACEFFFAAHESNASTKYFTRAPLCPLIPRRLLGRCIWGCGAHGGVVRMRVWCAWGCGAYGVWCAWGCGARGDVVRVGCGAYGGVVRRTHPLSRWVYVSVSSYLHVSYGEGLPRMS